MTFVAKGSLAWRWKRIVSICPFSPPFTTLALNFYLRKSAGRKPCNVLFGGLYSVGLRIFDFLIGAVIAFDFPFRSVGKYINNLSCHCLNLSLLALYLIF